MKRETIHELMKFAIKESEKSESEDGRIHPKVGAILTDEFGKILLKAYRGKVGKGSHAEYSLLIEAEKKGIDLLKTKLFVTLEPCVARSEGKISCAQRIVESEIPEVYIGMLDPNPIICGSGEIYLREKVGKVERFPGDLIKKIKKINNAFLKLHRTEHLPKTSRYVSMQISELLSEFLNDKGFDFKDLPFDWDVTIDDVTEYCVSSSGEREINKLKKYLYTARGFAYDEKYLDYSYDKDTRGLAEKWYQDVIDIFKNFKIFDYNKRSIVNVGIGNGVEGEVLFKASEKLTIIDIAPKSLKRASKILPMARTLVMSAEDLTKIVSNSQDIYISLRAFQSSYFGISDAIREAHRVIRYGGVIVISIANGFIGDGNSLIPGLVIPHTDVVDKNRPFELIDKIRKKLTHLGFDEIGIKTGLTEIFISARKA